MAKVTWRGDTVAAKINEALLDGAEEWARADVKTDAMENCPVDQGTLKGTHGVERDDRSVAVGVGGPAAPYALRQHEDATLHHTVGTDHWMEKALKNKMGELNPKLEKHVKSVL
jgi:hypothetical protein